MRLLFLVPTVALALGAGPAALSLVILLGAGDIANCTTEGDERTSDYLVSHPKAVVFTAGDNAYPDGLAEDFSQCYEPTWGRVKSRTHPALGNHEYVTPGAEAYFDYFGPAAGERGKGWYAFTVGDGGLGGPGWLVVVLNSNCQEVDCTEGAEQVAFFRTVLAAHPGRCEIAIWHHGVNQRQSDLALPLWKEAVRGHVDLVVTGHYHSYWRFMATNENLRPDLTGPQEITVGTGGTTLIPRDFRPRTLLASSDRNHGVLWLGLLPDAYMTEFIAVDGPPFTDQDARECVP